MKPIQQSKETDMYDKMKEQVKQYLETYLGSISEQYSSDFSSIASDIKKFMDTKYEPPWHVAYGKDFTTSITYLNRHFIFLYASNKAIMIFKH